MRKFFESYSVATGAFALAAAIILIATCQPAHAKSKISMQERIVAGQMAADELNDILTQNKIDLHRARCLRNGGTFDMNEVRY